MGWLSSHNAHCQGHCTPAGLHSINDVTSCAVLHLPRRLEDIVRRQTYLSWMMISVVILGISASPAEWVTNKILVLIQCHVGTLTFNVTAENIKEICFTSCKRLRLGETCVNIIHVVLPSTSHVRCPCTQRNEGGAVRITFSRVLTVKTQLRM